MLHIHVGRSDFSPLSAALESVVQPIAMDVSDALKGNSFPPKRRYSSAQYEAVAKMLLNSPHHAVDWDRLAAVVGAINGAGETGAKERGKLALQAMVQDKALAYRPKSELARDIPLELSDESGIVATAITPTHLYAMQKACNRGKF